MPILASTTESEEGKFKESGEEPGLNMGNESQGKMYSTGIDGKPRVGLNHRMVADEGHSF